MATIKLISNQRANNSICVALRDKGFSATRMTHDRIVTTASLDTIKDVTSSAKATFKVVSQ